MDFNSIYETVKPYIGTGAIGTILVAIIGLFTSGIKTFKQMKSTFSDTNKEAIDRFTKALPSSLTVSLQSITKQELAKIKTELTENLKTEFIEPLQKNTELVEVLAEAIAQSKLTPDEYKEKIAELLKLKDVSTTNSLKVELVADEEEQEQEEPTAAPLVD